MRLPKENNLEWLRLFFAAQVMISHSFFHLRGIEEPYWFASIPGVPAFFFVSGLLVYASYDSTQNLSVYFRNRFLRIFPGLVAVTTGGLMLVLFAKGDGFAWSHAPQIGTWFLAQITIGQAYNPDMFRDIGVGVINGSLWTITAELIFYFCVPILHFLQGRWRYAVLLAWGLSFAFYVIGEHLIAGSGLPTIVFDATRITPIYWGWMFLTGTLAFLHLDTLLLRAKAMAPALLILLAWALIGGEGRLMSSTTNDLGLLYFIIYCCVIFFLAFGTRHYPLSSDISYGTYVWHMVVVNSLIVAGYKSVTAAIIITLMLAVASWFIIERPAMRLKRRSMRGVT